MKWQRIQDFSCGGECHLSLYNQWGMHQTCFNCESEPNLKLLHHIYQQCQQGKNNIEVTVQSVSLHSCYNIHNLFYFVIFLLLRKEGGQPPRPPSRKIFNKLTGSRWVLPKIANFQRFLRLGPFISYTQVGKSDQNFDPAEMVYS